MKVLRANKKGDPCEAFYPDAVLIEIGDGESGQKHDKLYGGQNGLDGCPYRCVSAGKLVGCVTGHDCVGFLYTDLNSAEYSQSAKIYLAPSEFRGEGPVVGVVKG